MHTREIPKEQWGQFLDEFARIHRGEAINLETREYGASVQSKAYNLPLVEIRAQAVPGEARIAVVAGQTDEKRVSHDVPRAAHLLLAEEANGRALALEIQSHDGTSTIIRLGTEPQQLPSEFDLS